VKATTLGAGLAFALTIQTKADILVWPPTASDCTKIMRLEHLVSTRDFQTNELPDAFAWMELLGWLGGWFSAQPESLKAGVRMTTRDMGAWVISWCRQHPQAALPLAAAALRDLLTRDRQ
jgi:hypothetical protein